METPLRLDNSAPNDRRSISGGRAREKYRRRWRRAEAAWSAAKATRSVLPATFQRCVSSSGLDCHFLGTTAANANNIMHLRVPNAVPKSGCVQTDRPIHPHHPRQNSALRMNQSPSPTWLPRCGAIDDAPLIERGARALKSRLNLAHARSLHTACPCDRRVIPPCRTASAGVVGVLSNSVSGCDVRRRVMRPICLLRCCARCAVMRSASAHTCQVRSNGCRLCGWRKGRPEKGRGDPSTSPRFFHPPPSRATRGSSYSASASRSLF